MRDLKLYLITLVIGAVLSVPAAWAQEPGPPPADVNVVQDCWTTALSLDPDAERELYTFSADDDINFIWKHKILESCSSYRAKVMGYDCKKGQPALGTKRFSLDLVVGPFDPIPGLPEPLLSITAPAGSIPPGSYDWVVIVECDDTNGRIRKDGDVDDVCGANFGILPVFDGPTLFGNEPTNTLDTDASGSPPGRRRGEDGSTRPWCFEVREPPPPYDECPPDECATFVPCAGGICFCFELFDNPGTGGCIQDAPCGVDCSANGSADCAADQVCVFNTCCGFPNCVPAMCGARAPDLPFGKSNASDIFRGKWK